MKRTLWSLLLGLALLAGAPGCVYTDVTTKDGARLRRLSLFGNQQVGQVDINRGTLTGYSSQQAEAAAAIAEGVARGLSPAK